MPAAEEVPGIWKARSGDAKVELYDPGEEAAWYIAKMFPHEDSRYDVGGLEYFARFPESASQAVQ